MTLALMKRPGRGGRRKGAGRKTAKEGTEVVSLRLPSKDVAKFRKQARKRGIPLAELLKGILSKQVTVHEHDWKGAPAIIDVDAR